MGEFNVDLSGSRAKTGRHAEKCAVRVITVLEEQLGSRTTEYACGYALIMQ